MAKRRSRASAFTLGTKATRAATTLGLDGVAMARRLQGVSGAMVKPWLKAWQGAATNLGEQWLHDHTMPAASGRWVRGMAMAAVGLRQFQLYLPAGVGPKKRLPMVVMLHGCHQDAATFAHSTRMHMLANREGFAVLYVQQDRRANAQGCWNWFEMRNGRALQEARMVLAAIDQVCLMHPVDRARVAVAGLSAGASLAALLAQRHGERFCAVVMHSGVPPGLAQDARGALAAMQGRALRLQARTAELATAMPAVAMAVHLPETPTAPWPPLLVIHGDRDNVVSPRNAALAVAQWVAASHAKALPPVTQQRGKRLPMEVLRWTHGRTDVATFVMVHGLAHGWSGGAAALPFGEPDGPDACTLLWRFVQRQWRDSERAAATP